MVNEEIFFRKLQFNRIAHQYYNKNNNHNINMSNIKYINVSTQ